MLFFGYYSSHTNPQPDRNMTKATYKISKQDGEWIVANATGIIIAYFEAREDALEYCAAQQRDDNRSNVLGAYNAEQLDRELLAEFIAELAE